jgi:hypothetical protein
MTIIMYKELYNAATVEKNAVQFLDFLQIWTIPTNRCEIQRLFILR